MDSEISNNNIIVGVIGGLSHESSDGYSAEVHELVNAVLGGLSNANYIQRDVNFAEIRKDMLAGRWDEIGYFLGTVAQTLIGAGAEYVAVASNTVHKIAPEIEDFIGAEHFIHIADCVGQHCVTVIEENREAYPHFYDDDAKRVLLLGTQETMTGDFIKQRLQQRYNLIVDTPCQPDMEELDARIFNELCKGKVEPQSKRWFSHIIQETLQHQSVDAVILGCTELSMWYRERELTTLLESADTNGGRPITVIDSKTSHIWGIAKACLGQWKVPTSESEPN